jgi:L-cysteine:1D-myo-inositol 2-amino-2-deoxy-alpha-D-glucopyranoside ligase
MDRNDSRLSAWRKAAEGRAGDVLVEVRERLDDDLDTPGAVAAVDAAADRGERTSEAAALLGVAL